MGGAGFEAAVASLSWGERIIGLIAAAVMAIAAGIGGGAVGAKTTDQRVAAIEARLEERGKGDVPDEEWRRHIESRLGGIEGQLKILVDRVK